MASPRSWPFDDDPDELLAGTHADRPVVAIGVRAAWTRTLPGGSPPSWSLGPLGSPRQSAGAQLGLVLGGLAAVAAGWMLRFQPSPDAVAWRRGAAGGSAPPDCSATWSDTGGRSCTTWPSPAARPLPARPMLRFAPSRRCSGPSGSPLWPTRPGSASTPPLDPPRLRGPQMARLLSSTLPLRCRAACAPEAAVTSRRLQSWHERDIPSASVASWRVLQPCRSPAQCNRGGSLSSWHGSSSPRIRGSQPT
jgi:hypothetical protein